MHIHSTFIEGLFCLEATPFCDDRGSFSRIFCQNEFEPLGLSMPIAQMNISNTKERGTIRGMHYQVPPHAEIKIVRCIQGACFDVAIDLRKNSPTFLQHYTEILTEKNGKALYIPKGFAHGFQSLEVNTSLLYTHSTCYIPKAEVALHYKDPRLAIDWPYKVCKVSAKDSKHPFIHEDFMGVLL